jgi:hypothetical protein
MRKIISFSILVSMICAMSLHNTESMILGADTAPTSSLDNDFDFPNASGLNFFDFGIDTDEIAGIQRASEFSCPDKTG